MQCGNEKESTPFYEELAKRTDGKHLHLDKFSNIFDFMMAICYKEHGVEYFEVSISVHKFRFFLICIKIVVCSSSIFMHKIICIKKKWPEIMQQLSCVSNILYL